MPTAQSRIHDPYWQMRDFFMDLSMRRLIPKNPYNVLWLLETQDFSKEIEKFLPNLKKVCLDCIENNQYIDSDQLPYEIKNKLIDDCLVIERVKQLKQQHNVNIDHIAAKVARLKSVYLVKELLSMGMNPNFVDKEGKFALQVTLSRKTDKLNQIFWNAKGIDRYIKNKDGENLAFLALYYRSWKFLERILKEEPQLFLEKDNLGNTFFDKVSQLNNEKYLFDNLQAIKRDIVPDKMKKILGDIFVYMMNNHADIHINYINPDLQYVIKPILNEKLELELSRNEVKIKKAKI